MSKAKDTNKTTDKKTKFEYIFDDEESTSIWKWDLEKQPNGPISVEYKWKSHYLKELEMRKKRGR